MGSNGMQSRPSNMFLSLIYCCCQKSKAFLDFPFLDLPAELRNMIYRSFHENKIIDARIYLPRYETEHRLKGIFPLLHANRQIRHELMTMLFPRKSIKIATHQLLSFVCTFTEVVPMIKGIVLDDLLDEERPGMQLNTFSQKDWMWPMISHACHGPLRDKNLDQLFPALKHLEIRVQCVEYAGHCCHDVFVPRCLIKWIERTQSLESVKVIGCRHMYMCRPCRSEANRESGMKCHISDLEKRLREKLLAAE